MINSSDLVDTYTGLVLVTWAPLPTISFFRVQFPGKFQVIVLQGQGLWVIWKSGVKKASS